MNRIAVFASGSGSNAENIFNYFKGKNTINIAVILCNKRDAFVFERAKKLGVDALYVPKSDFDNGTAMTILENYKIDYIVLAGFLLLVPQPIISKYRGAILNIHPALLPKFGGKGMYGDNVHKAVVEANEKQSGITIHLVDEHYDEGDIIFQAKCEVVKNDDFHSVAEKVHELEYRHFSEVIENYINNKDNA